MARKKADMPVVAPPPVEEAIAEVVEAIKGDGAIVPLDGGVVAIPPAPVPDGLLEALSMPGESADDSNEGGPVYLVDTPYYAVLPEQAAPEAPAMFIDAEALAGVDLESLETQPGEIIVVPPALTTADLRALRSTIDTLVFGCDSQRTRQDAAAPAIEILDRLIGA